MTKTKKKAAGRSEPRSQGKLIAKGMAQAVSQGRSKKVKIGKSVPMANRKSASKSVAKSSKLASLKKMILGGDKKAKKVASSGKAASPKAVAKTSMKGPSKVKEKPASRQKQALPRKSSKGAGKVEKVEKSVSSPPKGNGLAKTLAIKTTKTGGLSGRSSPLDLDTVCREVACEGLATTGVYCRMHYIKNWKKIKRKEQILSEGKLNQFIEELVAKYPDKYIEAIRQDLNDDKQFAKVIYDLDLDESVDEFDAENESDDSLIDNIKRDLEDEGESF